MNVRMGDRSLTSGGAVVGGSGDGDDGGGVRSRGYDSMRARRRKGSRRLSSHLALTIDKL